MDGTLYLSDRLLPGAMELIQELRRREFPHYFLTNNSSRSRKDYVQKLNALGLPADPEQIISSGEATALYLKQRTPGARIYLVGTPSLEEEFESHGFTLTVDDPQYAVLGFDTTLTYAKLATFCNLVRLGLPYIATHPDINCPVDGGFIPDIGAMMALIEASTGRGPDIIIGKPHPPIVEAIAEKTGYAVEQIAIVGDRLYTDIALGQAGLATILVLSGETTEEDLRDSLHQPDLVLHSVADLLKHLT